MLKLLPSLLFFINPKHERRGSPPYEIHKNLVLDGNKSKEVNKQKALQCIIPHQREPCKHLDHGTMNGPENDNSPMLPQCIRQLSSALPIQEFEFPLQRTNNDMKLNRSFMTDINH